MVDPAGIEPATAPLKVGRSSSELRVQVTMVMLSPSPPSCPQNKTAGGFSYRLPVFVFFTGFGVFASFGAGFAAAFVAVFAIQISNFACSSSSSPVIPISALITSSTA